MIPRNIHQIFLGGDLPKRLQQQVEALKARNPGWAHHCYSASDAECFIKDRFGEGMFATYCMINPQYGAARADLLRHLLIYALGGVYLDIKSDIANPLDRVVRPDDSYLLSQWDNGVGRKHEGFGLHPELSGVPGGEYQTYFIIAEPGHPFSRAVIDRIVNNVRTYKAWSGVGKMGVVRTTGPSAYTLAIHPLRNTVPHRFVTEDEIGASMSIADYQHNTVFKGHYSLLTAPIVKLNSIERLLQRGIEAARTAKRNFRFS